MNSIEIIPSEVPDYSEFEIDGTMNKFTIPEFSTNSDLCGILKYELYENRDDTDVHPLFEPVGIINEEEGTVSFNLNAEYVGEIVYYIKVTAVGGIEYWDE